MRSRLPLGNAALLLVGWGDPGEAGLGRKALSEQRRAERESTYKAARIGAGARATVHCGVRVPANQQR